MRTPNDSSTPPSCFLRRLGIVALASLLGVALVAAEAKAQSSNSTTTTSVGPTPSSTWDWYYVYQAVALFPHRGLSSARLLVHIDDEYSYYPDASYCSQVMSGAVLKDLGEGVLEIDFTSHPGGYDQTQAVFGCDYQSHDGPAEFEYTLVAATNLKGADVLEKTTLCLTQAGEKNPDRILETHHYCGDAKIDEEVNPADALVVLSASIGEAGSCPLSRCDADGSGDVLPSDALRILKFAVGHDVKMICSGCPESGVEL